MVVLCLLFKMLCLCCEKYTDKLAGDVANLLAEFTNNVDNFTDCIGDQL